MLLNACVWPSNVVVAQRQILKAQMMRLLLVLSMDTPSWIEIRRSLITSRRSGKSEMDLVKMRGTSFYDKGVQETGPLETLLIKGFQNAFQ